MNRFVYIVVLTLGILGCTEAATLSGQEQHRVIVGAERTDVYFPKLDGKRVGILTNQTGLIGHTHIVDSLIGAGINLQMVFAPEHGFRGDADAGELVKDSKDVKTGVQVISLYGSNKAPKGSDINQLDVVIFDIQDVGLRYYTYLSSMHYMMDVCAEAGVEMLVLDRPNPNGFYVDGPILDPKHKSFVSMHPIPIVHGMTLGELAQMINGEGWLTGGRKCKLTVIPCLHYTHQTRYELPVKPSPNLPNMRSIYLYSSICFFEGTPLSIGRGTDFPFQVIGHPALKTTGLASAPIFSFTPRSTEGVKNPPLKDQNCFGIDLRTIPSNEVIWEKGIDLAYVVDAYKKLELGTKFFLPIFNLLTGVDYVKEMIMAGKSADEIKAMWKDDVVRFREQRKSYLLYEE